MLMPKILKRSGFGPVGLAAVTGALIGFGLSTATPAAAGDIYSWKAGDGHVAFTDNPKNIPARYRDQVQVRETEGIEDYARFTGDDTADSDGYSEQLADRLEYLRWLNSGGGDANRTPDNGVT